MRFLSYKIYWALPAARAVRSYACRHWAQGRYPLPSLTRNFDALRRLTPTTLRWSTLSSPAAERGLGKVKNIFTFQDAFCNGIM